MEVTSESLRQWAGDPEGLRGSVGSVLASFWLEPEAAGSIGLKPRLDDTTGSAWALFVWREKIPPLSRGFILPLKWVRGAADSPSLPEGLAHTAERVRKSLGVDGWGLCPGSGIERDLSSLRLDCPSAWAPLAAALEVARLGGRPDTSVFATGAWEDGEGMRAVDHIDLKLEAAANYAARALAGRKPTVFVPAANFDEASDAAKKLNLHLRPFPAGESDPRRALSGLLAELDVPPAASEPLETRLRWANSPHMLRQRGKREKYYEENLVTEIAERLSLPRGLQEGRCSVVLLLGRSPNLCLMLLLATRPARAAVVHTQGTRENLDTLRSLAARRGIEFEAIEYADAPSFIERLQRWMEAGGEKCWVEITGGNKEMTLAAAAAARRAGASVVYLKHQTHPDENVPLFGTEELVELEWAVE